MKIVNRKFGRDYQEVERFEAGVVLFGSEVKAIRGGGLQLDNFWQDLARDWATGRLYVPLDVVRAHGARLEDLDLGRWTPEWRTALQEVGDRTRALFAAGRPVADGVRGRLRLELRATWLGGHRILDRLAETDYDVFHARPSLAWPDAARIAAGALLWRRSA